MRNEVHMFAAELELFIYQEEVWFYTLSRFYDCRKLLQKNEFSFYNAFVSAPIRQP